MSDLAHLKIWDDPAIRDSLSWYLDVAENRRPAKFRIAATLATQIDPVASSECAMGRTRPPDPNIPGAVAGNPSGRTLAGNARWADSPRGMPRACLSHAHPL